MTRWRLPAGAVRRLGGLFVGLVAGAERVLRGAPASCRDGAGVVVGAVAAAWSRARGRHSDRFAGDEQYRALLLTAVGALLSTLMPPAVAAAATAAVGYSGLFDPPHAPPRARYGSDDPSPRPRYRSDEGPAGGRLWDRYDDD